MSTQAVATVFATTTSLLALWGFGFWLYRDYRVDRFRQNLFRIRDELFDDAMAGLVAHEHPAYKLLRSMLNGYIRFGHELNMLSVSLFALRLGDEQREWIQQHGFEKRWREAISTLDEPAQEKLKEYRRRMEREAASQLVLGSPILVVTAVPAGVLYVLFKLQVEVARTALRAFQTKIGEPVDEAALALGEAG